MDGEVIHRFSINGTNLQTPTGGLIFDPAGNLYMTMARGGRGSAGVFELSPGSGGTFTGHEVYSFPGPQGVQPYEGLVFDATGNLYSASFDGGAKCGGGDCGFVYKLSPGSSHWTASKLAIMHGRNGANPTGGVIFDSQGNLYGATYLGGTNKAKGGVVFTKWRIATMTTAIPTSSIMMPTSKPM
jgi:hypothetical protein